MYPATRPFRILLRSLLLKVDPRIVDALVAHATGVSATPEEETEKTAEPGEAAPADAGEEAEGVAAAAADADKGSEA